MPVGLLERLQEIVDDVEAAKAAGEEATALPVAGGGALLFRADSTDSVSTCFATPDVSSSEGEGSPPPAKT